MAKLKILLGCVLLALTTSCVKEITPLEDPIKPAPGLNQSDKEFMTVATYDNIGEVAEAYVAFRRAYNPADIAYSNMIIVDDTSIQKTLQAIADSEKFVLPTTTDSAHVVTDSMLIRIRRRRELDSVFLYTMVTDHDIIISQYQNEIANGQQPNVKGYAINILPLMQHHRHLADSLANVYFPR